jgi:hypothetical protein
MRSYQEAYAAARDEPAFSNGTEGYAWMENWCESCVHDKPAREERPEDGCPLIMVAFMSRTPSEWMEQPWQQIKGMPEGQTAPVLGDTYHCVEFRDEDDPGPGYEPVDPVSPDQLELFDATPFIRPRMFADVVAEAHRVSA